MNGTYKNGKIEYHHPIYHFLTGGNWKDGFSRSDHSGGYTSYYDVVTEITLDEGKRYDFTLIDEKAHIK